MTPLHRRLSLPNFFLREEVDVHTDRLLHVGRTYQHFAEQAVNPR